jgi:hypothetical protein
VTPFVLAAACFLLPFLEVSCGGTKVGSITGVQLVTGLETTKTDPRTMQTKKERSSGDLFVIIAAVCVAVAFFASLEDGEGRGLAVLSGLGGFGSLIVFKLRADEEILKHGPGLTISYQPGFYLACLFLLAGAGVCAYQVAAGKEGRANNSG